MLLFKGMVAAGENKFCKCLTNAGNAGEAHNSKSCVQVELGQIVGLHASGQHPPAAAQEQATASIARRAPQTCSSGQTCLSMRRLSDEQNHLRLGATDLQNLLEEAQGLIRAEVANRAAKPQDAQVSLRIPASKIQSELQTPGTMCHSH